MNKIDQLIYKFEQSISRRTSKRTKNFFFNIVIVVVVVIVVIMNTLSATSGSAPKAA